MKKLIFGTYALTGNDAYNAVRMAIEVGFRHVDTAQWYENEAIVARAVRDSAPGGGCQITTKVHPQNCTATRFLPAVRQSLAELKVSAIDLLLLHWPPKLTTEFDAMIELLNDCVDRGYAIHIGISNCTRSLMMRAAQISRAPIACNQIEMHPLIDQRIVEECSTTVGIPLQAYCPLGRGHVLGNPVIQSIARAHAVAEAAVIFSWLMQRGVVPISMTTNRRNAIGNLAATQLELSALEMRAIDELRRAQRRFVSIPEFEPEWD